MNRSGFMAYAIGGAVRDMYLDRHPKDFDLVTDATPEEILMIKEFSRAKYNDPAQAFGVTRVSFGGREVEIATFRKDLQAHRGRKATKVAYADLEEDVMRRDFTINALALDFSTGFIIDYTGGISDLDRGIIRFIGDPGRRIQEDPLRIMRAVRFKNQLGFTYHPSTAEGIRTAVSKGKVEDIATDRLREELTNLLVHPSRRGAFADLDNFGILERILPEVTAGKGVSQPANFHSEGDVWNHELIILGCLPDNSSKRLAWAALLHDIGKGPTMTKPAKPGDRIRFNRHYAVGAEMAKTALRRLKFSKKDIEQISWMIYHHMSIDDLPWMRPSRQQKMMGHPAFEDLLELHKADAAASKQPGKPHARPRFEKIEKLWKSYQDKTPENKQPSLKRDLGIDGRWLLKNFKKELGNKPGPAVGRVLKELDEWYRDEGVKEESLYRKKTRELLESDRD